MSNEMRRANALYQIMRITAHEATMGMKERPILEKLVTKLVNDEDINLDRVELIISTALTFVFGESDIFGDDCYSIMDKLFMDAIND